MTKIAILTDSACSRFEDINNGIFTVPLYVNYGNFSKKDSEEITPSELYKLLDEEDVSTSAPSIEDFSEKIKYIKSLGYDKILALALSANVSATFNAMRLALDSQNITHRIIDTKRGGVAAGILIEYAKDLIKAGLSLDEVYEEVNSKRDDTVIFFVVKNLKYLQKGGRISHLKGLFGRILRISPILSLDDEGIVYQYDNFRGRKRSIEYVLNKVKEDLDGKSDYYLGVNYSEDVSEIEDYKKELSDEINNAKFYYDTALTSVLGVHGGPEALVIGYLVI